MNRNISFPNSNKPFIYTEKDFIKCGFLKKQGGTFKTLKRRYFVLVNDVLYYFTNQTRNCLKGQIYLRNLELSDLEDEKVIGEFSFSILPEMGKETINETHTRYQFTCNDKKDAIDWMQQIKQRMYLRRGGGLFGTPLSVVMSYLKREQDYVPRVVFECCQRIREIGMNEEGIFRKNGQQSLVYKMKHKIDRAKYNLENEDIHTVCSLLKLYLRELPEPLIPFSHYDSLKAVGYRIEVREDLNMVRDKLLTLPLPNLQLLKYLCEFLLEVSTHPENRMEVSSLARVFSPNILRDQDTDPYIEESTSSIISITVAAFIKSHEELFLFEYEAMEKFEGDGAEDEDTYSLASEFSNINLTTAFLTFDEMHRSDTSLSQESEKSDRASSITFYDGGSCHSLEQSDSHCQSLDHVDQANKGPTPQFLLPNGSHGHGQKCTKPRKKCAKCLGLEKQLLFETSEKGKWHQRYIVTTKICAQLQDEVKFLRLQLAESRKMRISSMNALS